MWVQLGAHSGPEKPRQGGHAGRVRVGLRGATRETVVPAIWSGPALHGSCGHVTGPAPQGRPPGCTRSARALILSPVSPCGPNYYRNRVRAIAWQCHGVVKEVPNMVRLK